MAVMVVVVVVVVVFSSSPFAGRKEEWSRGGKVGYGDGDGSIGGLEHKHTCAVSGVSSPGLITTVHLA